MKIELNIADIHDNRVINAFCLAEGYQAVLRSENPANGALIETPNPETKRQFVKRKMAEHFKARVASGEGEAAVQAARKTIEDDVAKIAIT